MRIWLSIGILLLGFGLLQGQDNGRLEAYMESGHTIQQAEAKAQISSFLNKLNSKTKKSDRTFLRTVFNQTHRLFLKDYRQYASFNKIFSNGQYDCVTATALYSLLLDELGYTHSIYETKYHVFLLVDSPEGQFLIESTDPINGFEYQHERIIDRIARYQEDQDLKYGQLSSVEQIASLEIITPSELTGLLYYNQCVKFFNDQQFLIAKSYLSRAKLYYDSPRTQEMEALLLHYIASSKQELNSDLSSKLLISQRQ